MNSTLPLPTAPLLLALNHLLAQEEWARTQLQPHRNKIAELATELFNIRLQVATDGQVQAAPEAGLSDVTIRAQMADLPLMMQHRERAFSWVRLEGDAEFAQTIAHLAQNLRWEAEYDLQRWFGEIAAARMVAGARAALDAAKSGQQKLAENLAEYLVEENPTLVHPQAMTQFAEGVGKTRDDVERLTKRIQKLTQNLTQKLSPDSR
jgi:ubiquinone biosynthesis protein UbiJ